MPVFACNRQTRMKTQIAMLMAAAFCGWFAAVYSTSAQTWAQTCAPPCGKTRTGKSLRDFAPLARVGKTGRFGLNRTTGSKLMVSEESLTAANFYVVFFMT